MANVLTVVWLVIAYVVTQTSIMVWAALMLPNPVSRARRRLERGPVAAFVVGGLFWIATLVIAGGLVQQGRPGPVQMTGWLLSGPMLACSVLGGAAFACIAAERIRSHAPGGSHLVALVLGALFTTLAGLLPVIGWFVFLPITGFMAIGAGLSGLLGRKERPAEATVSAPAPPAGAPAGLNPQME